MREERQLQLIRTIIEGFRPDIPLHRQLKQFFSAHRQMGSRDRKQAASFAYAFFRLRHALTSLSFEEQVAYAIFICDAVHTPLLDYCIEHFTPFSPEDISFPTSEKIVLVEKQLPGFRIDNLFPFRNLLSEKIRRDSFLISFVSRPLVWIRISPAHRKEVLDEIISKGWPFTDKGALGFIGSPDLESLASWQKGFFEIQDLASQRCIELVHPEANQEWWDACAGSGGKSLALLDRAQVKLTATDARSSILVNLQNRFVKAGAKAAQILQADVGGSNDIFPAETLFDGIIADVPCSGSGTWARTPERMSAFSEEELPRYANLQHAIASRCARHLKPGGVLLYITCSVFSAENESVIARLEQEGTIRKESEQYLQYSDEGADTMFCAILRKT